MLHWDNRLTLHDGPTSEVTLNMGFSTVNVTLNMGSAQGDVSLNSGDSTVGITINMGVSTVGVDKTWGSELGDVTLITEVISSVGVTLNMGVITRGCLTKHGGQHSGRRQNKSFSTVGLTYNGSVAWGYICQLMNKNWGWCALHVRYIR